MRLRAGVIHVQDGRCAELRGREEEVGIRLRTGRPCAGGVWRGRSGPEKERDRRGDLSLFFKVWLGKPFYCTSLFLPMQK